ncbi:MAG: MBL fold metallo-hydrolase [Thermoleophilia bacterium]|nr:MBL fold metallo-hydrolase [Thermoleophilia bacterium]
MATLPQEIAPGVHCLEVGKGIMRSNVYFVCSGPSWSLIDVGSEDCGPVIREAAETLFGEGTQPAAILLTHDHPDHAGAALTLARLWDLPIYVHPDEMPIVHGNMATFKKYANPLDRWLVLPIMRMMGKRRAQEIIDQSSFKEAARALDPDADLPGLADWEFIPTPGHTPGHIAFFRQRDRVLISGDALVTLNLNSPLSLLRSRPRVAAGPWYTTWDRQAAMRSVAALASLEPRVLAGGHGAPMSGAELAAELKAFSQRR